LAIDFALLNKGMNFCVRGALRAPLTQKFILEISNAIDFAAVGCSTRLQLYFDHEEVWDFQLMLTSSGAMKLLP
jgi:hypothetical protein